MRAHDGQHVKRYLLAMTFYQHADFADQPSQPVASRSRAEAFMSSELFSENLILPDADAFSSMSAMRRNGVASSKAFGLRA